MRKNIPVITVWLILAGCILYYSINIFQFVTKTYYVDESQLYKLDTFHLLSRAYRDSDDRSPRGSSKPKLVFTSTNGYSFSIDKNIFRAIVDQKKLEDTLMYHDLKFTVYTDHEYFEKYQNSDKPIYIRIYQIQIGNTKYIDIAKLNELGKSQSLLGVFGPPVIILFLGFLLYKEIHSPGWCTNRRRIIWSIAFLFATIVLFLLT